MRVRSLRFHLLALSLIPLILLAADGIFLLKQVERAGRIQTEDQLLATARALSSAADGELQGATGILIALRASEAMARHDWKAVDAQARAAVSSPDAWVVVMDRTGRQLVNTKLAQGATLPSGPNPSWLWRLLDAGRPRVCNLTRGYVEPSIVCVDVPFMRNGRAEYDLAMIIKPHLFQSIIDRQHIRPGNRAALLDRRWKVIWRNSEPERFVGQTARAELRSSIARMSFGTGESPSLEGVPMLDAFSRSSLSGWTFVVAVPLAAIHARPGRTLSYGLFSGIALLLLGAAMAFLLARRLVRAVEELSSMSAEFHKGVRARFRASGLEEIDEVGRSLEAAFAARQASEERFAFAQEVGGIGSWDWDVLNDEGHVSETYKTMHGLTEVPGPLKLQQVLDVIHPDDLSGYLERLAAARGRLEPSSNEYRVICPDGAMRWIAARGRPIVDESGRYVRAVGVALDVTAERRAELELRELNVELEARVEARTSELARTERRFRAIFDTSYQMTALARLDGSVLLANQAALDVVKATQDKVRGRRIWHAGLWAANPVERAKIKESLKRVRAGEFVRYEVQLQLGDTRRAFDFSMKPVVDDLGSPVLIVVEGRDITELKRTEEALRQAQKLESIGQLTGGVAHDFNNLLTPIIASLDMLQRRRVGSEREQRWIDAALQSAEKAKTLVHRLLAFARRQPLRAVPVDLRRLVEGMADLLASTSGPRIRVAVEIEPNLPPVNADPNQLEMAILNLWVNARDAMPDGGRLTIAARVARAGISAEPDLAPGSYVRVSVADTGSGMDEATRQRAIEPFFSTKGSGKGTGLGLSMVHGLAAQLGGGLSIKSRVGLGTTVELWLPVADPVVSTVQLAPAELMQENAKCVLLVDDDKLVRASTAEMLSELGYAVVEASSAEDALRIAQSGVTFDIVVTDHLMTGMTGAELAREVYARWPDVPVLIVSGYADVDAIAPDLQRLAKPFRQAELGLVLQTLVAQRRSG